MKNSIKKIWSVEIKIRYNFPRTISLIIEMPDLFGPFPVTLMKNIKAVFEMLEILKNFDESQ